MHPARRRLGKRVTSSASEIFYLGPTSGISMDFMIVEYGIRAVTRFIPESYIDVIGHIKSRYRLAVVSGDVERRGQYDPDN